MDMVLHYIKGLKVHSSLGLIKQLKGELRKRTKPNLMKHGLLLLIGATNERFHNNFEVRY
jgi:hypothetical protein